MHTPLSSITHRFGVLFLVLVLLTTAAGTAQARTGGMAHLQTAVHQTIAILNDPVLKRPENRHTRREKLRRVIYREFDFARMARSAVGRDWNKFSANQKKRFVTLFQNMLENTYMKRIERHQGETVDFVKEVAKSKNRHRVDSVVRSKGQEFQVSYRLHYGRRSGWKVYDVIIEGVSVVTNYRSQLKQLLRGSNPQAIEQVLQRLQEKVNKARR